MVGVRGGESWGRTADALTALGSLTSLSATMYQKMTKKRAVIKANNVIVNSLRLRVDSHAMAA